MKILATGYSSSNRMPYKPSFIQRKLLLNLGVSFGLLRVMTIGFRLFKCAFAVLSNSMTKRSKYVKIALGKKTVQLVSNSLPVKVVVICGMSQKMIKNL